MSVPAGQCSGDNFCEDCGKDNAIQSPVTITTANCCAVDECIPKPPTDPCATNNCGGHGKCSSGGPDDSKCTCENTFEEIVKTNGDPSCACPSDTKLQANINRCVSLETSAPTANVSCV